MRHTVLAILFTTVFCVACSSVVAQHLIAPVPGNPQTLGDPDAGYEYLLYGDYIGSGLPMKLYKLLMAGQETTDHLDRRGSSRGVPHAWNVFEMQSGVEVVAAANCLACHASEFNGELVIGLGNSLADWTDRRFPLGQITAFAAISYPPESPEIAALQQFSRGAGSMNGKIDAPFKGVVPAFRLEEIAAAHRVPEDLSWSDDERFDVLPQVIASDVPAWWHIRKKHALYANGMGRGDFSKLIQQINVVAIDNKEDAARINESMRDLLAYLYTLEAPEYPGEIDRHLAAEGEVVFEQHCAKCHGTYGETETYPNKLVHVDTVGTDPAYARFLLESELWRWYNKSWYATTEPRSSAEPSMAYMAPPLDGIWTTAPYFHNGAVPMLDQVLDSTSRPTRWRRSFDSRDYDVDRMGWKHTVVEEADDPNIYDTTVEGYGNGGHTFGDDLTDAEREAVLEYLKTL